MTRWFLFSLVLMLNLSAQASSDGAYIRLTPADSKKVFHALNVEIKDEVKVLETNDGAIKCGEYNHIYVCELMLDVSKTEAAQREDGSVKFGGRIAGNIWSSLLVASTARPGSIVKILGGFSCSRSPRGSARCMIKKAVFELE